MLLIKLADIFFSQHTNFTFINQHATNMREASICIFLYQFFMYAFFILTLDVSLIIFTFYSYKHIIITTDDDDVQTAQYLSLTNCYRTQSITLFHSQYKYQTKSTFQFHVSPTRSIEAK